MLERVGSLEPWIEHAVGKNKVRSRCSGQGPPDAKAAVLPDTMDKNSVVLGPVLFYPTGKSRRISVAAEARTQCVNAHRGIPYPRIGGRIEGDDFHLMAATYEGRR